MTGQAWSANQRASRKRPCPVCGKPDWCGFSSDGDFVFCQRSDLWGGEPAIRHTDAGWMFPLAERGRSTAPREWQSGPCTEPPPTSALPRTILDQVYRFASAHCGLDEHGRQDLITRRRFFSALEGDALYFSLPSAGKANEEFSEAMIAEFGLDVVAQVPGFLTCCRSCEGARTGPGGACTGCQGTGKQAARFRSVRGGRHDYAIVACDEHGLAFWAQVRRLPLDSGNHKANKYTLLSSSRPGDASLAGLPKYHVAGGSFPIRDEVWITEGIIKAEIAATRLQRRVIGLAGVSVDQTTLAELRRLVEGWRCVL